MINLNHIIFSEDARDLPVGSQIMMQKVSSTEWRVFGDINTTQDHFFYQEDYPRDK